MDYNVVVKEQTCEKKVSSAEVWDEYVGYQKRLNKQSLHLWITREKIVDWI